MRDAVVEIVKISSVCYALIVVFAMIQAYATGAKRIQRFRSNLELVFLLVSLLL